MDFNQSPLLVIWEVTQACDLECVHCRATAQERHEDELTTEEGRELLNEIKRFGNPLMVFTGGDPLKRPDLYDLARHSVSVGLRTNVTPSATPLLTAEAKPPKACTTGAISPSGSRLSTADEAGSMDGCFGEPPRSAMAGFRVHLAHRRNLSQRLPAGFRRQCPQRFAGGRLSELQPVPDAARAFGEIGQVQLLRVQQDLRRIARPRLRADWQSSGSRSTLLLSAVA